MWVGGVKTRSRLFAGFCLQEHDASDKDNSKIHVIVPVLTSQSEEIRQFGVCRLGLDNGGGLLHTWQLHEAFSRLVGDERT